jgi:hypothetical protein
MSATATKVPAFTAAQHIEMLRLGLNPAMVEARWMRARPLPVIDRDVDGYTIILPSGRHFLIRTPPTCPVAACPP